MDLNTEQLDLLKVVRDMESEDLVASTREAGLRLLQVWKNRGGAHFWTAQAPWHGTSPYAEELRAEGLLEVDGGMAHFRHPDQPSETVTQYRLSVTAAGRRLLNEMNEHKLEE